MLFISSLANNSGSATKLDALLTNSCIHRQDRSVIKSCKPSCGYVVNASCGHREPGTING